MRFESKLAPLKVIKIEEVVKFLRSISSHSEIITMMCGILSFAQLNPNLSVHQLSECAKSLSQIPQLTPEVQRLLISTITKDKVINDVYLEPDGIQSSSVIESKQDVVANIPIQLLRPNVFPILAEGEYCVKLVKNSDWSSSEVVILKSAIAKLPNLKWKNLNADSPLKIILFKIPAQNIIDIDAIGKYYRLFDNIAIFLSSDIYGDENLKRIEGVFFHEFGHRIYFSEKLQDRWIKATRLSTDWHEDIGGNWVYRCGSSLNTYPREATDKNGGLSGVHEDFAESFRAFMQNEPILSSDRRIFFENWLRGRLPTRPQKPF